MAEFREPRIASGNSVDQWRRLKVPNVRVSNSRKPGQPYRFSKSRHTSEDAYSTSQDRRSVDER